LEGLFRKAIQAGEVDNFEVGLDEVYHQIPENVLIAAWHYRLAGDAVESATGGRTNWALAVPIALLSGLAFWLSSSSSFYLSGELPLTLLFAGPLAALFVLLYLALSHREYARRAGMAAGGLALLSLFVLFFDGVREWDTTRIIWVLHLPVLAWIGVGGALVGWRADPERRFAFITKSVEVGVTVGLFAIAGGVFTGVTQGLFFTLGIDDTEPLLRLLVTGIGGATPVLAVALVYNARADVLDQLFNQGIGKVVAMLMRLLLPLTILVLLGYLALVPANFMQPFENRDVLIVSNLLLFAVVALLVAATPLRLGEVGPRMGRFLRWGIGILAGLTLIVSLYALSAVLWRTGMGGLTINRVTIIGWNGINIWLLGLLLARQLRGDGTPWLARLHSTISTGLTAWGAWAGIVAILLPLIFSR
jgi:hypothetical protein